MAPPPPQLLRALLSVRLELIVACCALAPVYARHVAHTGPNEVHAGEKVMVSGKLTPVVGGGSYYDAKTNRFVVKAPTYLGPTWWHTCPAVACGVCDEPGADGG